MSGELVAKREELLLKKKEVIYMDNICLGNYRIFFCNGRIWAMG